MADPRKKDVPGRIEVGEYSPVKTPINTGEVVTTADSDRMKHSIKPTGPEVEGHSSTATWSPPIPKGK